MYGFNLSFAAFCVERLIGMRIFEFDSYAYVAGLEFGYIRPILAVGNANMAKSLMVAVGSID